MTATIGEPHLSAVEKTLFAQVLVGVRNYMEFGMGGSTLWAARAMSGALVSVDSDPGWVQAVRQHDAVAPLVASGRASIMHADIGPVGNWGTPVGDRHASWFPRYIGQAWAEWARRMAMPDVVFVDGRFRVACCHSVALAFAGQDGEGPMVMMHDVVDARPGYRDAFLGLQVVEQVDTLCLMRRRKEVPASALVAAVLERQFDPN